MGIDRREGPVRVGGKCVDSQWREGLVRVGGKCGDSLEGGASKGWREVRE